MAYVLLQWIANLEFIGKVSDTNSISIWMSHHNHLQKKQETVISNNMLKAVLKTLQQYMKLVHTSQNEHWHKDGDVTLVSSSLTMDKFHCYSSLFRVDLKSISTIKSKRDVINKKIYLLVQISK